MTVAELIARAEGKPCVLVEGWNRTVFLDRRLSGLYVDESGFGGEHDWLTPETERPDEMTDGFGISLDCLVVTPRAFFDRYFSWWYVLDSDLVARSFAGDHGWVDAFLEDAG